MPQCYICSTTMEQLIIDPRDKKLKPCTKCEEVVQENLESLIRRSDRFPKSEVPILDDEWDIDQVLNVVLDQSKGSWRDSLEEYE